MSIKLSSAETSRNRSSLAAAVATSDKIDIAPFTATYIKDTPTGWANTSVGSFDTTNAHQIAAAVQINNIYVTDSSWNILDDTAVSTSGGYIKLIGVGFKPGAVVYIQGVAASQVTYVSSTELRVVTPAISSGTLQVYVVNTDNSVAIRLSGIVASGVPSWVSTSPLASQISDTAFSIQLSATSDSTIAYSLQNGSSLPSGVSLTSSGLLSGTISTSTETTYTFTLVATDLELQDTARLFSVSVTTGDAYFYVTPLLLSGDANTWITDTSTSNTLPTIGGDTRPVGFSPYNSNWSQLFAAGNYLTVAGNTNLAFGTSDFTIECFFYFTDVSTSGFIYDSRTADPQLAPALYVGSSTVLYYVNGSNRITSGTIYPNRWYHLVVSRVSSNTRMFLNGTQTGSTYVDTTNYVNGSNRPVIGTNGDGASFGAYGYISNLRVLNGTGTTSPTVPTTALTAVANTQLLTLQSNLIKDNSNNAFTITPTGSPATKSFSPFAETDLISGSAYFDGTTDYLTYADSTALELGSGDFCVELWIHPTSVSGTGTIIDKRSGTYGPLLFWRFGTSLQLYMSSNNSSWDLSNGSTIGTVAVNRWYHVAIYRVGSSIYTSFNGVVSLVTASGSATPYNNAGAYYIGTGTNGSTDPYTGYISNLRFVIGSGVYTSSNFTPPTSQLTAITNTKLLSLQYRVGDNNNRFVDESGLKSLTTRFGNSSQGSFTPYSADDGYWSISYPTNTQRTYMAANTSIIDVKSTGTWTVEGWVMLTTTTSGAIMLSTTDYSTSVNWYIGVDTNRKPVIYWYTGSVVTCVGSTVLNQGQWYFLQFRSNNGALTIGVNGVAETLTGTTTMGNIGNSTYFAFGNERTYAYPCYLYDVRISNSVRSYNLPTTPMSSDANTTFLGLRKRRVIDEGPLATALTNVGMTQPWSPFGTHVSPRVSYSPTLHGGSTYFDGSGDYVYVTNSTTMTLGVNDHTIEFWMYPDGTQGSYATVWGYSAGSTQFATNNYYFSVGATSNGVLLGNGAGGWAMNMGLTYPTDYNLNTWSHVVITRSGTTFRIFINGILKGVTSSVSQSIAAQGASFVIGSDGSTNYYKGWISGFRTLMSIPTAYQTSNTTVGTTIFTPPTAPAAVEANTIIQMGMTHAGIVDASGRYNIETIADAKVTNVRSKFGTGSIYLDGTGDYLSIPNNMNANFAGDFTIECWMYCTDASAIRGIISKGNGTNGWGLYFNANPTPQLIFQYGGSILYSSTGYVVIGDWCHIAATRQGTGTNNLKLFVNGVIVFQTTLVYDTSSTLPINVGTSMNAGNPFMGYMDDIRLTQGYARYTTNNFTLPTASFLTR